MCGCVGHISPYHCFVAVVVECNKPYMFVSMYTITHVLVAIIGYKLQYWATPLSIPHV